MPFQLAQLNIAKFKKPAESAENKYFFDRLDAVNEIAEGAPGFVWRLVGNGNDATDIRAFDDPDMIVNLSVWRDLEALAEFVYRNDEHLDVMRRRRDWFERMAVSMVLWWVPEGHQPTVVEAKEKLSLLEQHGPHAEAFTFRAPFPAPNGTEVDPIYDVCA